MQDRQFRRCGASSLWGIENPAFAQFIGKTSHFVGELATAGFSFASLVAEVKL